MLEYGVEECILMMVLFKRHRLKLDPKHLFALQVGEHPVKHARPYSYTATGIPHAGVPPAPQGMKKGTSLSNLSSPTPIGDPVSFLCP